MSSSIKEYFQTESDAFFAKILIVGGVLFLILTSIVTIITLIWSQLQFLIDKLRARRQSNVNSNGFYNALNNPEGNGGYKRKNKKK